MDQANHRLLPEFHLSLGSACIARLIPPFILSFLHSFLAGFLMFFGYGQRRRRRRRSLCACLVVVPAVSKEK